MGQGLSRLSGWGRCRGPGQGGLFPGGLLLALAATAAVFLGGQRATGSQ
ncbi:DUF6113 family protein, partial [Streptomyces sp. NPDC047002]